MNSENKQNLKLMSDSAKTGKSSVKVERRRVFMIAAAILLIFAAHFAWQFSFVQKENLRAAQDSLNEARSEVANVEIQPQEEKAELKSESATEKMLSKEPVRDVAPIKYLPPVIKTPSPAANSRAAREPRSERLRRAEKLLTGF